MKLNVFFAKNHIHRTVGHLFTHSETCVSVDILSHTHTGHIVTKLGKILPNLATKINCQKQNHIQTN